MAVYQSESNRYWELQIRENNMLENLQDIFTTDKDFEMAFDSDSDFEYSHMISIENVISGSDDLK